MGDDIDVDKLRVGTPCHESWDAMEGDDRSRFCSVCSKDVFHLSAMTQDEAQDLVDAQGKVCIRYDKQPDGSPRFKPSRRQLIRMAAGSLATLVATPVVARASGVRDPEGKSLFQALKDWWNGPEAGCAKPENEEILMGDVAPEPVVKGKMELEPTSTQGVPIVLEEEPSRRPKIQREEVEETVQEKEPDWAGVTMGIMID